jgi:cytochrome c553
MRPIVYSVVLCCWSAGTSHVLSRGAPPNSAVDLRPVAVHTAMARAQGSSLSDGRMIFRFETFGDEQVWTDRLGMNNVIANVTPVAALGLGLKVDSSALPPDFLATHSLTSPATTVALLSLDAVVGVKATVKGSTVTSLGITCALCHSTVDNSVAPGVGTRRDGWPNTQLDPGKIIALSPNVSQTNKMVYNGWGPGKYDPRFNIDGINDAVVIPPAFGLGNVALETYTGDGPISYWNSYVAITQMGGRGIFVDPRIGVNVNQTPDLVTPKLPALRGYKLGLSTPSPPSGSFDPQAAKRGEVIFNNVAKCATCHIPPTYTDINLGIRHDASETGMDPVYASRSATKLYRTTPLRALWQHPPYFHDGSAPTLEDVVEHYRKIRGLNLSRNQQRDLVEFLKTL